MPIHILPHNNQGLCSLAARGTNPVTPISRRNFLTGMVLAGVTSLVQPSRLLAREDRKTVWALIADTHISSDLKEKVRGENMVENLQQVVEQALALSPDRILFNGDMAFKRGTPADYRAFLEIIEPIRERQTPLHCTLGNHDHRADFAAAIEQPGQSPLENKLVSTFVEKDLHWVFLDSLHRVNRISGRLGARQLEWLGQVLDGRRNLPTIVCLHHHPEDSAIGLKDTDAFLGLLKPRRQVKAVIFGHTHGYRAWDVEGLHLINLPATGYFFNPLKPLGWIKAVIGSHGMELEFITLKKNSATNHRRKTLTWRADA